MPSNSNKYRIVPVLLLIGGALLAFGAGKATRLLPPLRKGKITSRFGDRDHPLHPGTTEFHNGIDIAVPEGTNVYAIAPGQVTSSYYTDKGGKQLVITQDNGYKAGYAHLRFPLVSIGDKVERGAVIAQSGRTGNVTGAHLHFTLRNREGKYIDPEKSIRFATSV